MTTAPARLYGPNGQPVNGHAAAGQPKRAAATPIPTVRFATFPLALPSQGAEMLPQPAEEHALAEPALPTSDPIAEAEAEAIRARAWAEAEERRIAAGAEAKATEIKAAEEAEKQRILNERAAMRLEKEKADHAAHLAKKAKEQEAAEREALKARREAEVEEAQAQERGVRQERSENLWKWGARSIYAVGLIIAAPVQFMHFWDPKRPFLVAAPALLEGIALVLAFGAAWAVAHRRDVAPYRVGIMLGAAVAAGINMYGGMSDSRIGFNAGLIGAIASLGGPIVLMAYEHGIAQKADGIPSWRERRAARQTTLQKEHALEKAKADKKAAEEKAAADKAEQQKRATEEQERKDKDRREGHPDVWEVADSIRRARGAQFVTEQIWGEAWSYVTGYKTVGMTAHLDALSRDAHAQMKAVAESVPGDALSQVGSQKAPRVKRDPDAPDGRRFNGGTPPRRVPGDTAPYSPLAKKQASIEQTKEG